MKTNYEILIRFDNAGAYQGSHLIQRDSVTGELGNPQPVKPADWPALARTVNDTAVAKAAAQEATILAFEQELKTAREAHAEAEKEREAVKAELREATKPQRDRELESIRSERARLERLEAVLLQ